MLTGARLRALRTYFKCKMKSGRVKYYSFSVAALRDQQWREQTNCRSRSGQAPASSTAAKLGAFSGRDRQRLLPQRAEKNLNAHHRMFGIGEVAEARALRSLEILRHVAVAVPAEK